MPKEYEKIRDAIYKKCKSGDYTKGKRKDEDCLKYAKRLASMIYTKRHGKTPQQAEGGVEDKEEFNINNEILDLICDGDLLLEEQQPFKEEILGGLTENSNIKNFVFAKPNVPINKINEDGSTTTVFWTEKALKNLIDIQTNFLPLPTFINHVKIPTNKAIVRSLTLLGDDAVVSIEFKDEEFKNKILGSNFNGISPDGRVVLDESKKYIKYAILDGVSFLFDDFQPVCTKQMGCGMIKGGDNLLEEKPQEEQKTQKTEEPKKNEEIIKLVSVIQEKEDTINTIKTEKEKIEKQLKEKEEQLQKIKKEERDNLVKEILSFKSCDNVPDCLENEQLKWLRKTLKQTYENALNEGKSSVKIPSGAEESKQPKNEDLLNKMESDAKKLGIKLDTEKAKEFFKHQYGV